MVEAIFPRKVVPARHESMAAALRFCDSGGRRNIRALRDCTTPRVFYVRAFYAECNRTARSASTLPIPWSFGLGDWKMTGRSRLAERSLKKAAEFTATVK